MTTIILFRSWRRAQIVAPPFTLKEITTGIINPNRSKSSFNVFYSTFCSELNRYDDIQEQARVMGDGLREVQQHFQNIDAAAVDDAGFDAGLDLLEDDLLEAEAVDPDDIEEDLTDYFDIRVKRRMVCNTHKLNPFCILFYL